jgi:cytochrome b pre-mRNA-processing protein 3
MSSSLEPRPVLVLHRAVFYDRFDCRGLVRIGTTLVGCAWSDLGATIGTGLSLSQPSGAVSEIMRLLRIFKQRGEPAVAFRLYDRVVSQSRNPVFYASLGVPDTLQGRFEMLVLHMFLVVRRLRQFGPEGVALAQDLFDVMFGNMDENLRGIGVGDLTVGRRVKQLARSFYGRSKAYEAGLAGGGDSLAEALARNLYGGKSVEPAALNGMVDYVQAQAARLSVVPLSAFATDSAEFGPFPRPEVAN